MAVMKYHNKEEKDTDLKKDINIKRLVAVVIFSGLFLIIFSIRIENFELHYVIRGLGISIIGGAFIAWAITDLISRYNIKKMLDRMKAINENIRESFERIKESEDNGLLKIYEPYDMKFKCQGTNRLASEDFTKEVKDMINTEEEEIKICGLSLRLFFNSDHGKFFNEIRNAFERMDNKGKPIVKILMLDPKRDCFWKKQREIVEDHFTIPERKLGKNLEDSINWLRRNIKKLKNKDKIMDNIRFYNATPDFFLFITSQCILFEIYHMGVYQLEEEKNIDLCALGLGGHVPVLKFDSRSPMYKYLSAHFDYYFDNHVGTLKE